MLSKTEFHHILDLLRGTVKPDPVLSEMKKFFLEEFGCEIYDCIVNEVPDSEKRLCYAVWDREDQESFFCHKESYYGRDEEKDQMIKEQFSSLCRMKNIHKGYWDPEDYFAVPVTIADELLTDIQHKAEAKIKHYLDSFLSIRRYAFQFDTVHIFYKTDQDILRHEEDGLSDKIRNRIFEFKKEYDEFSVLEDAGVVFSSLQTLNEKYNGNMFYYFK